MLKRLCHIIIGILCGFPVMGFGAERVQVMVLPFEINAQPNLEYLKDQVPQLIQRHMERDGATIVKPDAGTTASGKEMTIEAIRSLGSQKNADVIIWGSLTWLGQNFSLDARMVEVSSDKSPASFFSDGEGVENLPTAVKSLSDAISSRLFKREKIAEIRVNGNKRIEQDAIKRIVKTQPGDTFLAKNLSEDLKAIYSMGYFDDVRVESEDSTAGKIIIFVVKEKPTIRHIYIRGGKNYQDAGSKQFKEEEKEEIKPGSLVFDDEKILKSLDIKTGSIINIFKIQSNIKRIEDMYKEKNYHNVKVTYTIKAQDNNQADLEFNIDEGKKILIKEIRFEGNQAYADKKLKKIMKTSEKGFWSWLTSSGDMKAEDLNQDVELLTSFYYNSGYIQAKIGEPIVEIKDNWIFITIKIDEGQRYKVGKVQIVGDILTSEADLMKKIKIPKEEYFSRQVMRDDIIVIGDLYSDEGYAYADIIPQIDQDTEKLIVNITFTISKGNLVYFEEIRITGNTKTRDKVIRRELDIYEQELFSGKKLKRGIRNLNRLDYFEDVKINTNKGSEPDKMLLDIDVKEKPTGTFSFGGGYSSVENMFVVGSIAQRNFLGRGQVLQLKGQVGSQTTRYTLSFVEPWLFDIPLSAGADIYDQYRDYSTYKLNSIGGAAHLGYPVYDFTRAYISYGYDISDLTELSDAASSYFKDMAGKHTTSSLTPSIRYDSRDKAFNPTEGANSSISVQYAGDFLGGDVGFTKYVGDTGRYFPLFWSTVGFLHAKAGYVDQHAGAILPPWDRFYLGGINSLRGFSWDQLSPHDAAGDAYGGNKFVQFNAEYIFPLIKDVGLMGVVFYDTGNLYDNNQDIDLGSLRQSTGFGIRWYSPMGPIRLENGFILDPKPGESQSGRWEFTMGQAF
ncbi:MAG: outer membrane protein assembly factor BamA [Deltaproteobacteria bacterium]|nr:outer membrane protein assembly factor BamA [Deltaproteobacteria bacterium]